MGSDIIPDAELDCVGLYCPIPISQAKEEIDKLEVGQVFKVGADELDGLPPIKMHCSNLAADALHEAIKDYKGKRKED